MEMRELFKLFAPAGWFLGCSIYFFYYGNINAGIGYMLTTVFYIAATFYRSLHELSFTDEEQIKLRKDITDVVNTCNKTRDGITAMYHMTNEMEEYHEMTPDYYRWKKEVEEKIVLPNINIDELYKR